MAFPIGPDAVRSVRERTPTTAEHFNATAYRDKLIAGGIDPTSAAEVAAKTAAARATTFTRSVKLGPQGSNLFDQATQVEALTQQGADKKVGTAPLIYSPARDLVSSKAARPKRDGKVIDVAAKIADERPSGEDMAFMHAIMCQVGLPRSKVGHKTADGKWVDALEFERQCGGAGLNVAAGKLWDGKQFVQQIVPYGASPRLMLAWMNTYAVRHKTPEIPVGHSAAEFLRVLGKDTSGGRKGGYTVVRIQMQALSACCMTLGFNAAGKAYTYEGKPIKKFEAWLNTHDSQSTLWPGVVTFSDEYFRTLINHAVPLDVRALSALRGSALAMDVYTMLADRLHRITGRPVRLYWANLRDQFGQEYQGKEPGKDFKKKFLPALRDALAVYPQARVKQVTGGLLLMPSPPPIPYKPT
ncbi:plasmid replication initiator protein [Acidovorax sp. SUPP2522]|uniref:replication protein RepA n=1 Tax=unclassified Acidovorax TaxID=2684926 RepID=UPI002349AC9D|nr:MULTISPECIES: replication protein RepA [unclassified Acidovorax]WCM99449.1 replication protein RepA [Acidovorax sp. GBBC 1281]GKT16309.1 plasmid replication initiator protein [Acidovorax sp. SUPP2522]